MPLHFHQLQFMHSFDVFKKRLAFSQDHRMDSQLVFVDKIEIEECRNYLGATVQPDILSWLPFDLQHFFFYLAIRPLDEPIQGHRQV